MATGYTMPTRLWRAAFASPAFGPRSALVWDNITPYVIQAVTSYGRNHETQAIEPGRLDLELLNIDGRFYPFNTASPYYHGGVGLVPGKIIQGCSGYVAEVLKDNPVAYWRLGELSGTIANDENRAHQGTYTNGPALGATGAIPQNPGVVFTAASSQYVDTGSLGGLFGAGDCTYEAWIKCAAAGASQQVVVSEAKNTAGQFQGSLIWITTGGALAALAVNDAGTNFTVTGPSVVNNALHHVVMTKSGSTMSLYCDGISVGTPVTLSGTFTLDVSQIGDLFQATVHSRFFNGTIDEVAVYPTALSAARIAAHYTAGTNGLGGDYLFTGRINSYPLVWVDEANAEISATGIDGFEAANLTQMPASPWEFQIRRNISLGATAWYRLGEPANAAQMTDSLGADAGGPRHGSYLNGVGLGAAGLITNDANTALGIGSTVNDQGRHGITAPFNNLTTGFPFTIETWFNTTATASTFKIICGGFGPAASYVTYPPGVAIGIDRAGLFGGTGTFVILLADGTNVVAWSPASAAVDGGLTHHVVVVVTSTQIKPYLDGVALPATSHTIGYPNIPVGLGLGGMNGNAGAAIDPYLGSVAFNGIIDEVVVYNAALTANQIAANYQAGLAWTGELSGARVGHYLDAIGVDALDRSIETGQSVLQGAAFNGAALQQLQSVATTESGLMFCEVDGTWTFRQRNHLQLAAASTSPQVTLGDGTGEEPYELDGTEIAMDTIDLFNQARVTRNNGQPQQADDAPSEGQYGTRTILRTGTLEANDNDALAAAQYLVGRLKNPLMRGRRIHIHPVDDPTGLWPHVQSRRLQDQILMRRSTLPGGGTAFSQTGIIEFVQHTITEDDWDTLWGVSYADTTRYWILGDSTYGVLGSTTKLAY